MLWLSSGSVIAYTVRGIDVVDWVVQSTLYLLLLRAKVEYSTASVLYCIVCIWVSLAVLQSMALLAIWLANTAAI